MDRERENEGIKKGGGGRVSDGKKGGSADGPGGEKEDGGEWVSECDRKRLWEKGFYEGWRLMRNGRMIRSGARIG